MLGLIINTTGRDAEHLMFLNNNLKKSGYDTFMLFIDVNEETALQRIKDRPASATDPRDAGRPVDIEYFNTAYRQSKNNSSYYAMQFGNQFAYVDNTATDNAALKAANSKINQFMAKPLTPIAQNIVDQLKQNRN
jgi:thymidylate kinase